MKKNKMLKIINPFLALFFLSQVTTGIFHDLLTEYSHEAFEIIHGFGGFILVILVIIHIILNWQWIKTNFLKTN